MLVPILLGSKVDVEHAEKIASYLKDFGVESKIIVASAHKVPEKVFQIVSEYNKSDEEIVYVTIAGMSNGLSGVVGGNSIHPVVACPPFKDYSDYLTNIHSTLQMPSDTPTLTSLNQKNTALSIVRMFALKHPELREKLRAHLLKIKESFN